MRNLKLLTTAAAILALGAGGAYAQIVKEQAPDKAPAAQRQAPAEKMGPAIQHSERKAPETTGQGAPQKLEPGHGANSQLKQEHGNAPMDADSGAKSDMKSGNRATTGQGAASGAAKLSTEQRSKISTIIRAHKVAPTHLNISVQVGARLPESVHFYPLPVEVIAVYPEWRGYDYIMVGEDILVVDPASHEIVAIISA